MDQLFQFVKWLLYILRKEEGTTSAIEYVAIVPLIVFIAFAGVQLLLGVQTALVANSAAREAARAAVVCEDWRTAVEYAVPQYKVTSASCSGGGRGSAITCSVSVKVPPIAFEVGSLTANVTMRKETCK